MKNKIIKILSIIFVVIVLVATMVLPTFAVEPLDDFTITFRVVTPLNSSSLFSVYGSGVDLSIGSGVQTPATIKLVYGIDTPRYDAELDKYYYQVTVRTNGYVPYFKFYNVDGEYTGSSSFIQDLSDLIYLDTNDRVDFYFEYSDTLGEETTYTRRFYLSTYDLDEAYREGWDKGYAAGIAAGKDWGYDLGYYEGYDEGYDAGVTASQSEIFGKNLLGQTLNAPLDALNHFTLFEVGGQPVTLGYVVGALIALFVLIAFLKMFAGG